MGEKKLESADKLSNQQRRLRRRVGEVKKAEGRFERKRLEDTLGKSEKMVRVILGTTTESVLLMDKDATILAVNKTAAQRFGKSIEEIVGLNIYEHGGVLAPPTVIKPRLKQINKVIRSGKPVRFEDRHAGRIYDNNIYPIFNEKGQVMHLAIFSRDITEQKKNEEMLRELKNRYQTLYESAPVGIGICTREGRVLEGNDRILKMTGYSLAELKQINLIDTYKEPQVREVFLKQLQTNGYVRDFEVQLKRRDGTVYYASLTMTPLTLDGQDVLLAVQEDISSQKKLEEVEKELSEYREKMVRAEQLASVGTLSASLSHEITQPLTAARLSIESALAKLRTRSIPGTIEENLRACLSGVSDASLIVERFRDYARGMTKTVVTEISLNTIAERIVKLLKGNATAAKVNVLIKNMGSLPHIRLSEKDAEVLFFALIDNAIQAADGEKKHRLTISGAVEDGYIELRFADDCGGIAPENVDKIFELFFTTKPMSKGTGLGLCIVRQIVSRVGGKVRVESNLGEGSTFFITLPIKMGIDL